MLFAIYLPMLSSRNIQREVFMSTRNCCSGNKWMVTGLVTQGSLVTACRQLASAHNSSSVMPSFNALMSGLCGKHLFSSLETLIFGKHCLLGLLLVILRAHKCIHDSENTLFRACLLMACGVKCEWDLSSQCSIKLEK